VKSLRFGVLLCALVACSTGAASARAANVDLSLNVFPSNLGSPNSGGTWRMVAKTDAPLGIAGISAFLQDVNVAGLMVEADINSFLSPYNGTFSGFVNVVYSQDTTLSPIIAGVGRPAFSDGPDPLGNPQWDGATWIFKGTYNGQVPSFAGSVPYLTQAIVLNSTTPGDLPAAADVTTVVRVATPEPSTLLIAMAPLVALAARIRKRRA
jgi:hypothetical protein